MLGQGRGGARGTSLAIPLQELPIGKSSKNIKISIFPLKAKSPGIVRILYSYYGPPPLANFPFKIPAKNGLDGTALAVRIYILTRS